ncbi:MAG TPA: autoantigen p27 domain-containing protein [Methanocorpusculum sp.]|nr:autoantigen p27 domain-containing protein [Methanocorpusculum sp.]
MTKTVDEIMAVYLLNGGKMLSETCSTCGAPLFEIKGRKTCVVCEEHAKEEHTQQTQKTETTIKAETVNPAHAGNIVQIKPSYAAESSYSATPDLDILIASLIKRAQDEPDPAKCLTIIECLRTAAEAKTILTRFP